MNIAVRYLSNSGNTKYIADVMAQELNIKALSIEDEFIIKENVDILFLGCGTYFNTIDKRMKEYINNLDSKLIKKVYLFSSALISKGAIRSMSKLLKEKNINVSDKVYFIKSSLIDYFEDEYKAFVRIIVEKESGYKEDSEIVDILDDGNKKDDYKKEELVQKYFEMLLEHYVLVKLRVLDPRINDYDIYTTMEKDDKNKIKKIGDFKQVDKDVYQINIGKYYGNNIKGTNIIFTIYDCNNSFNAKDLMYKHNKEYIKEIEDNEGVLY